MKLIFALEMRKKI